MQEKFFVPFITCPYLPLISSFRRLAKRPGFLSSCERWRQRMLTVPLGYMGDIYDGKVWKSFESDFLSTPYSFLLTLNVDWFQPHKHLQYSVGVIYLVVQNLPREERHKEENVIIVGVIPGPHEPSLSIDSYLLPLVDELKTAYLEGFSVTSCYDVNVTICLALSCVTCDIPSFNKSLRFLRAQREVRMQ